MKSKIRFIIVACFIAGVAVTGFNMAQNHNSLDVSLADIAVMARADDGESPGNQATCYSTYKTALIFGTHIFVCGTCVQVKASEYSDAGICYF